MSKSLEAAIREAAAAGRLDVLTVAKCASGYQASMKNTDRSGWRCEVRPDPIDALLRALAPLPAVAPIADPEQRDIFE